MMNRLKKFYLDNASILTPLLIYSVIVLGLFFQLFINKYFIGLTGDNPFPFAYDQFIRWSLYRLNVWNESSFGVAILYPTEVIINIPLFLIASLGFPIEFISKIIIFVSLVYGAIFVNILLRTSFFISKSETKDSSINTAAFTWGIFFIVNPLVFTRIAMSHYWYLIAYSLSPSILYLSSHKKSRSFVLALLLYCFSMIQFQFIFFSGFIFAIGIWFLSSISRKTKIIRTIILGTFTILVNIFWLAPFRSQQNNELIESLSNINNFSKNSAELANALNQTGYFFDFYQKIIVENNLYFWTPLSYILFLLFGFGIIWIIRKKQFFLLPFPIITIISLFLIYSFKSAFNSIFYWLFTNIPLLAIFRELYHFQFIVIFGYILVGWLGVLTVFRAIQNKQIQVVINFALLLIVLIYSIPFAFINSNIYTPQISEKVANEYRSLDTSEINQNDESERILYLPLSSIVKYDKDQFIWGRNRFMIDGPAPTLDISNAQTKESIRVSQLILYSLKNINNPYYQKIFLEILSRYSFSYILLDKIVKPIDEINLSTVKSFLDLNFEILSNTENLFLYKFANTQPQILSHSSLVSTNINYPSANSFDSLPEYSRLYADINDISNNKLILNSNVQQSISLEKTYLTTNLSSISVDENLSLIPLKYNLEGKYKYNSSGVRTLVVSCQNDTLSYSLQDQILKIQNNAITNENFEVKNGVLFSGNLGENPILEFQNSYAKFDCKNNTPNQFVITPLLTPEFKLFTFDQQTNISMPDENSGNWDLWTVFEKCGNEDDEIIEIQKNTELTTTSILSNANEDICAVRTLKDNLSQQSLFSIDADINVKAGSAILSVSDDIKSQGRLNFYDSNYEKLTNNTLVGKIELNPIYINFKATPSTAGLVDLAINTINFNTYNYTERTVFVDQTAVISDELTSLEFEKNDYSLQANIISENLILNGGYNSLLYWGTLGNCNRYDNKSNTEVGLYFEIRNKDKNPLMELGAQDHAACTFQEVQVSPDSYYSFSFDHKNIEGFPLRVSVLNQDRERLDSIILEKSSETQRYNGIIKTNGNTNSVFLEFSSNAFQNSLIQKTINQVDNVSFQKVSIPSGVLSSSVEIKANPTTTYQKIDRSRYIVQVESLENFYISMNQSFHEGWKAYILNPSTIDSSLLKKCLIENNLYSSCVDSSKNFNRFEPKLKLIDSHFKSNGFANAWYIDTDNNLNKSHYITKNGKKQIVILLEYDPQNIYEIGLIVSFLTVLLTFFWLLVLVINDIKYAKKI